MFKLRSSENKICTIPAHLISLWGRACETSVSSIVVFERQTRPKSTTLANYWVSFGPEPPYLKARL